MKTQPRPKNRKPNNIKFYQNYANIALASGVIILIFFCLVIFFLSSIASIDALPRALIGVIFYLAAILPFSIVILAISLSTYYRRKKLKTNPHDTIKLLISIVLCALPILYGLIILIRGSWINILSIKVNLDFYGIIRSPNEEISFDISSEATQLFLKP